MYAIFHIKTENLFNLPLSFKIDCNVWDPIFIEKDGYKYFLIASHERIKTMSFSDTKKQNIVHAKKLVKIFRMYLELWERLPNISLFN